MKAPGDDTSLARFLLELRSKGVTDPAILNAFESVPRARFLPDIRPELLYAPIALPLPCGEEAEDPFTLARHLRLIEPRNGLRIYEIGTGSGYFSAILAQMGLNVFSVERYRNLRDRAQVALNSCGFERVTLQHADGSARQNDGRIFDRIVINGAMEMVSGHIFERLAPDGIALGARTRGGVSRLTLWRKDAAGLLNEHDLGPVRMGPIREGLPQVL